MDGMQLITAVTIHSLLLGLPAVADDAMQGRDWQEQRLLAPTAKQRHSERQGRVFIYDGLDEILVDRALDSQFDRVESMMFVRVKPTAPQGYDSLDDGCN